MDGINLPYANESLTCKDDDQEYQNFCGYETDILILDKIDELRWKPRIIVKVKINVVATHNAIKYSKKAQTHKNVHTYLNKHI